MKAALIALTQVSGTVTGIIVADADKDFPPDKTSILVNLPDDLPIDIGWKWDSVTGFTPIAAHEVAAAIASADLDTTNITIGTEQTASVTVAASS